MPLMQPVRRREQHRICPGIDKKYGQGVIEELEVLKHQESHWTDFEYKTMIDYYNQKVKKLHADKGI